LDRAESDRVRELWHPAEKLSRNRIMRLEPASWIQNDVKMFMERSMKGSSVCVSLMTSYVDRGANAARADFKSRTKRLSVWAAEASVLIETVKRVESRLGFAFESVYVVTDDALPEESQELIAALRPVSYRGMVTARKLGHAQHDPHIQDVLAWRDMEVCTQTDFFISNDMESLHECGLWSTQVRIRRNGRQRKETSSSTKNWQCSESSSFNYVGDLMRESDGCLACRQPSSAERSGSKTWPAEHEMNTSRTVHHWLQNGRRQGEFPGSFLSSETGSCRNLVMFGGGLCDDGGKVLCSTERLNSDSCIVYSFGVGFDHSFEDEVLAMTRCQVFSFDPTPSVIEHMQTQKMSPSWKFLPWGISSEGGEAKLELKDLTSMSTESAYLDSDEYDVQFFTLQQIMQLLGHTKVDFLKLDIEGMEFQVVDHVLDPAVGIEQLVIEMHSRIPGLHTSDFDPARLWVDADQKITSAGFLRLHSAAQAYFSPGLDYHSCPRPCPGVLIELSYLRTAHSHEVSMNPQEVETGPSKYFSETVWPVTPKYLLPWLEPLPGEFGARVTGLQEALWAADVLTRDVILPQWAEQLVLLFESSQQSEDSPKCPKHSILE